MINLMCARVWQIHGLTSPLCKRRSTKLVRFHILVDYKWPEKTLQSEYDTSQAELHVIIKESMVISGLCTFNDFPPTRSATNSLFSSHFDDYLVVDCLSQAVRKFVVRASWGDTAILFEFNFHNTERLIYSFITIKCGFEFEVVALSPALFQDGGMELAREFHVLFSNTWYSEHSSLWMELIVVLTFEKGLHSDWDNQKDIGLIPIATNLLSSVSLLMFYD